MLPPVGARVFGNLADAGCPELQAAALSGSLDTYLGASDDDLGASRKEGAVAVDIANDDFRCRQHQPLGVAHIATFLQLCHYVELYLLHLCLALPDLRQVFLYAALKCGEFLFPFFKYIIHLTSLPFHLFTIT